MSALSDVVVVGGGLVGAACAHYRELVPALADAGAPDPCYDVCGAPRIAFREMDDEYATNVAASTARHPGVLQPVDSDEAQARFPPLAPVRSAVFNPRGARVDGAWTPALAASVGMRVGVRPVRGQIVHLQTTTDTSRWPVLQPILSHYVVPWSDGRVALGATVEDVGFDARSTAGGLRQLFSEGLRVSPGLSDATFLEVRVGLRPVSHDDLPIIGALPRATNVFVATGHGANGLHLGPVTGRLIADLIVERPTFMDPAPFTAARLAST